MLLLRCFFNIFNTTKAYFIFIYHNIFEQINHIRYLMDHMLSCSDGEDIPIVDDEFRVNVPKLIRDDLLLWVTIN